MDGATNYLLTQGVLGIACLALSYVTSKLYHKNEVLQQRIEQLHELRLADAKEAKESMEEIMHGHNKNIESLNEKFEIVQSSRR